MGCRGRILAVVVAVMTLVSVATRAQTGGVSLPTPEGLYACRDNDAVASAEKRIAPSIGAEYLACFTSDERATLQSPSRTLSLPAEYALAMTLVGGPYGRHDLDALLSKVQGQWKNFNPLSKEHEDYLARINSLIKGPDSKPLSIQSEKPVLVSIDRTGDQSYVVVSIREYAIEAKGESVRSVKASAVAMVLQGTQLVRLEVLRELRTPSDVDVVRTQIAAWCRAVAGAGASAPKP